MGGSSPDPGCCGCSILDYYIWVVDEGWAEVDCEPLEREQERGQFGKYSSAFEQEVREFWPQVVVQVDWEDGSGRHPGGSSLGEEPGDSDLDNLGADEASVAAALAAAERDREQADQERRTGRDETAQAVELMAEADREDRDRQQDTDEENQRPDAPDEAGNLYDSAERRQELAVSLEGLSDREAVQARLNADQDQATPPTAAVAKAPGRSPKARKTRGASGQAKLLRKGISR
ncbi:hypothetical protein GCM10027090_17070 [Sinomonas soli]